ncbi:MAG: fimbrillin family protein [Bacteroidota bacterium]|nr:fimbrillin family protein [Bacteroidota bacterium]
MLLLALIACEGDVIDPALRGRPIELSAEIAGMRTRVTNSTWEKGDAIGVYMIPSGGSLSASVLRDNVKYSTTGNSSFTPANEKEQIIFPFDGSDVDFIGYHPYRDNISNHSYPVNVSNQSSQSQIDLLYSNNTQGLNDKNPHVGMQFTHQLTKVVLNIEPGQSVNLSELSVIISNANTEATFDLATGMLSSPSKQGDIPFRMGNGGTSAEAILLPQSNLSAVKLWFVIGDEIEVYSFPLGEVLEINAFQPGTKYTYNVTLFAQETTIAAEGSITPWVEGPTASVTANRTGDTPPVVKGSKKAPFTVAEAQASVGQPQVWVEGYIVGSFKGTSINSFVPEATATSATSLALADTQNETDKEKVIPVELPAGAVRKALNLKDNPANFNKKVKIKGNIDSYYSAMGLKGAKEYEFID